MTFCDLICEQTVLEIWALGGQRALKQSVDFSELAFSSPGSQAMPSQRWSGDLGGHFLCNTLLGPPLSNSHVR